MRKTYAFAVPGMPFDGNTIYHQSLGGSESAALYLARELARTNEVYVFSNCTESCEVDGVRYFPLSFWKQFALTTPHDVNVVQRVPELMSSHMASRINMVWMHDLGLAPHADTYKGVLWNVDRFACVSDFHRQQVIDSMNLPGEVIWPTRNGIDVSMFDEQPERDRFKIMYAARPERGLDNLLKHVLPEILEREPRAHLCIAGYDNNVEQWQEFYNEQYRLSENLPVTWLGNLSKADLYHHYATAGSYVYPTPSRVMPDFREVSCISAMECQAAGLPFISANNGALPETLISECGELLDADPVDNPDVWADTVVKYMHDDKVFYRSAQNGREKSVEFDWSYVADEWDEKVEALLADRNDDPDRLIRHFVRRSDIEAAKYVSQRDGVPFDFSPWDHSEAQYKEESTSGTDQRCESITELLKQDNPSTVLDFGCAQGGLTYDYAETLPETNFVAIDLEPQNIANAYQHERIEYIEGSEDDLPDQRFDTVLATEVLEHQREPWLVLEKVEAAANLGGRVIISVPYGPWEFGAGEYWHRWEFDPNDLHEMLGAKPNRAVGYHHSGCNSYTGDVCGYYIITYEADHEPIPSIDMERKAQLQRPRQTVSACLLAGPGCEDALRLHLKSYAHLCDEMVIADTGISDEARRIFDEYGPKYIPAPNPKENGFDAARNVALPYCTKDWVLWIDTDEHMVEPDNMPKYLRENVYQGYGIRQHHFAVDTYFDPDMPVRLFRNRPRDGKMMKFHGRIHEHPELELNEGPGPVVILSDVNIAHYGYMVESIRQDRFWRNLPLLQKDRDDYPDRLLQKHFVCRDNIILAGYIYQTYGWNEKIEQLCRETIRLYREYFLGKRQLLNIDTSVYYHQALEMLEEGFEFESDLVGGRKRFASREDLDIELRTRMDDRLGDIHDS